MKWFFAVMLGLSGAVTNLLLVTGNSTVNIPALIALNVALVGLALIWKTSYFESNVINATGKDLGIALLCFSVGTFVAIWGAGVVNADSCADFYSRRGYRLRDDIVRFVELLGYCKELGYLVAAVGGCVAVTGVRLVFRITQTRVGMTKRPAR
jgi:hypothetical protein